MKLSRLIPCVLVVGLVCAASEVRAQVVQASSIQPAPGQFIVGDWYDIVVQRQGVTEKTSGILLKADDDWIVLASVTTSAYEKRTGTPVLMYLPYVGKSFRYTKTIAENFRSYSWVPRNGMQIERHSTQIGAKEKLIFKTGEAPRLGEQGTLNYVKDGKGANLGIETRADTADETLRRLTEIVPIKDMLIVHTRVPLTAAELKLITSTK
jgi:hypothetical protein